MQCAGSSYADITVRQFLWYSSCFWIYSVSLLLQESIAYPKGPWSHASDGSTRGKFFPPFFFPANKRGGKLSALLIQGVFLYCVFHKGAISPIVNTFSKSAASPRTDLIVNLYFFVW